MFEDIFEQIRKTIRFRDVKDINMRTLTIITEIKWDWIELSAGL